MLSNHTIKYLKLRIERLNQVAIEYPKLINDVKVKLMSIEAQLSEAEKRKIIGFDIEDGAKVYVSESNYVYVEGKPSGWDYSNFKAKNEGSKTVCYDGGTKWFGTIIFTK
jgi:hypothetical protein